MTEDRFKEICELVKTEKATEADLNEVESLIAVDLMSLSQTHFGTFKNLLENSKVSFDTGETGIISEVVYLINTFNHLSESLKEIDENSLLDLKVVIKKNPDLDKLNFGNYLFRGVSSGYITVEDDNFKKALDLMTTISKEWYNTWHTDVKRQMKIKTIQSDLEVAKAEELKKLEHTKKYILKKRQEILNSLKYITCTSVDFSEEYSLLNWLQEHTIKVTASIPDWAEETFVDRFGDVPHTVVETAPLSEDTLKNKLNKNENIELSLLIDTPEEMPKELLGLCPRGFRKTGIITNIGLIATLVERFEFEFSK